MRLSVPWLRPPRAGRRPRAVVGGVLAALLLTVMSGLPASTASAAQSSEASVPAEAPLVVRTDKGKVQGAYATSTRSFQGIPYAAPPVGSLRWRSPTPAAPWKGVRAATSPGDMCAQTVGSPDGSVLGSEDCLYLNVTTPRTVSRKLPVMVYIPGGAFVSGAGSWYDPSPLVDRGDVIVVTMNYRLGMFGFLGLPQLTAEGGAHASGLYGIEDQQAAMAWVRHNISAFGGDAHNVTVFGESAGAASACIQLVSPPAKGLFDKLVAESGCGLKGSSLAQGEAQGTTLATAAGCTSGDVVACLRGKPTAELMARQSASIVNSWGPLWGGAALPEKVSTRLAKGDFPRVPVLQGANHNEGRLFVAQGAFGTVTADNYQTLIASMWGNAAPAIAAEYPISAYSSPGLALATLVGDGAFACPALKSSRLINGRAPLYAYEFNDTHAPPIVSFPADFPLGATHTSELSYLFDFGLTMDAAQRASADRLIDYWANFARKGRPNGPTVPHWPTYAPAGQVQSLGSTTARPVPAAGRAIDHHCAVWEKVID
ncbi:carboxylesterase/lipase family protein [Streptomyces sp. NPDC090088]|uniref:carboxylesterase/lipase family protein n=1 Tax=Streptomyces sp. NPDC090088 TaxID=3365944 RepID=UPI00381F1E68